MKNSDSMKRMKAMAEAIDKIMKEQEKQNKLLEKLYGNNGNEA